MAGPDGVDGAAGHRRSDRQWWRQPNAMLLSYRTNRWRWPWATATTLAAVAFAILTMFSASLVLPPLPGGDDDTMLLRVGEPSYFALIFVGWSLLALSGLTALRLVKGDPWRDVFTATDGFHARDMVKAALAVLATYTTAALLAYIASPHDFSTPAYSAAFCLSLVVGVLVIFVQSTAEEIFFRGVLLRAWGAVFPYAFVAPALIMTLFIALHVPNGDVQRDLFVGLIAFVVGEAFAYYALLRTKSLAAPIGLHFANNAFQFFIVRTRPPDDVDTALVVYTDPVYAAHGSRIFDFSTHLMTVAGALTLAALLFHPRSPLYLPRRTVADRSDASVIYT